MISRKTPIDIILNFVRCLFSSILIRQFFSRQSSASMMIGSRYVQSSWLAISCAWFRQVFYSSFWMSTSAPFLISRTQRFRC